MFALGSTYYVMIGHLITTTADASTGAVTAAPEMAMFKRKDPQLR